MDQFDNQNRKCHDYNGVSSSSLIVVKTAKFTELDFDVEEVVRLATSQVINTTCVTS